MGSGSRYCLDSPARKADFHKPVGLYVCHRQGGNQVNIENKILIQFYYLFRLHRYSIIEDHTFVWTALVNQRTCTDRLDYGPVINRVVIR